MKSRHLILTVLAMTFFPADRNGDGKIEFSELFHKPRIEFAALSLLQAKQKQSATEQTVTISTVAPETFKALAGDYGVTPEYLASLVLTSFTRNAPKELRIISSRPVDEQDCATCLLRETCASKAQRQTGQMICFEKLEDLIAPVAPSVS